MWQECDGYDLLWARIVLNVGSASGRRVDECALATTTGARECVTGCEREEVDAVVPRDPPAWRSVVRGAVAGVRCFAGLCVGDFWSEKPVVPYTEVLLEFACARVILAARPTGAKAQHGKFAVSGSEEPAVDWQDT